MGGRRMSNPTPTYHKIQSVFKRDPDNRYKTFLIGEWAEPEFGYLADLIWEATEKVDGTNCRIHIDESREDGMRVGGRTENAQLHADLYRRLTEIGASAIANDLDGLTLYGEGYGAGIQKGGGNYRSDKGFILFDVMVTETGVFLERRNVEDIAKTLRIQRVLHVAWKGTLNDAVSWFRSNVYVFSTLREGEAEGWVLRPKTELRTRLNRRIITKMKVKDFPGRSNR